MGEADPGNTEIVVGAEYIVTDTMMVSVIELVGPIEQGDDGILHVYRLGFSGSVSEGETLVVTEAPIKIFNNQYSKFLDIVNIKSGELDGYVLAGHFGVRLVRCDTAPSTV